MKKFNFSIMVCLVIILSFAVMSISYAETDVDTTNSATAEQTSMDEQAPAEEQTPAEEAATPAEEQTPAEEEATPAEEQTPAEEAATPAEEQTPAEEEAIPAEEQIPAEEEAAPAEEQDSVSEEETVEAETVDAGVTPDSPLYVFDRLFEGISLFFTFDSEEKTKLYIKIADERIAEANILKEDNNVELLNKTIEIFLDTVKSANEELEEVSEEADVDGITDKIQITAQNGQELIIEVSEMISEDKSEILVNALQNELTKSIATLAVKEAKKSVENANAEVERLTAVYNESQNEEDQALLNEAITKLGALTALQESVTSDYAALEAMINEESDVDEDIEEQGEEKIKAAGLQRAAENQLKQIQHKEQKAEEFALKLQTKQQEMIQKVSEMDPEKASKLINKFESKEKKRLEITSRFIDKKTNNADKLLNNAERIQNRNRDEEQTEEQAEEIENESDESTAVDSDTTEVITDSTSNEEETASAEETSAGVDVILNSDTNTEGNEEEGQAETALNQEVISEEDDAEDNEDESLEKEQEEQKVQGKDNDKRQENAQKIGNNNNSKERTPNKGKKN